MTHLRKSIAALLTAGALSVSSASAVSTTLISGMPDNPGFVAAQFGTDGVFGYEFTVGAMPLQVSALGIYDFLDDGLDTAHTVGLWTATGTLLTSVTIDPVSTDLIDEGNFIYVALGVDEILLADTTYVLGATYSSAWPEDRFSLAVGSTTYDPSITYIQGRAIGNDGSLAFPTDAVPFAAGGYIGPNMQFTVVPEPAHMAGLFGLGALSLALYRRRRIRA